MLSEAYGQVNRPKRRKSKPIHHKQEVLEEGPLGILAGALLGGGITGSLLGAVGGGYLGHKVEDEDESTHDKTGHLSDHDLLDAAHQAGTAGPELLSRAQEEIQHDGSLSSELRDDLARDVYAHWAHGDPHAKDDEEEEDDDYEEHMNILGADHGYTGSGKGHTTD